MEFAANFFTPLISHKGLACKIMFIQRFYGRLG